MTILTSFLVENHEKPRLCTTTRVPQLCFLQGANELRREINNIQACKQKQIHLGSWHTAKLVPANPQQRALAVGWLGWREDLGFTSVWTQASSTSERPGDSSGIYRIEGPCAALGSPHDGAATKANTGTSTLTAVSMSPSSQAWGSRTDCYVGTWLYNCGHLFFKWVRKGSLAKWHGGQKGYFSEGEEWKPWGPVYSQSRVLNWADTPSNGQLESNSQAFVHLLWWSKREAGKRVLAPPRFHFSPRNGTSMKVSCIYWKWDVRNHLTAKGTPD